MTHHPAAARALLASALSVTTLLVTAACSTGGREGPHPATASASAAAPAAKQPPAVPPALTEEQARAALITEADLGEPWAPTRGAATWRDGLLKATTMRSGCQHLLDILYTEDLFGPPTGPRATSALDEGDTGAQLRYHVAAHRTEDVDRALSRLDSLPRSCGEFTAALPGGGVQYVEVTELPLPEVGDAREALRVTLTGETADAGLTYLTMDIAAVRVGEDAISLTHGGLGDVYAEVTQTAVQLGARRLTDIRKQGRADI